nr:hypothetical protein [Tanacetum cinerariifolium]
MPEDPYAYVVASFQAPPSPDYMPGPEYPPSPEFIPEPVYPEFMPAEDDILPAEEQPLPAAALPTTESDPDKDHVDDPEEDPANYLADEGDEGDDEYESSDDDEDDDIDIEGDEEGDEYLAPADSTAVALPAINHAPSAKETEPFKTDESAATPPPHPAYRITARMSIRPQTPISLPSDTEIVRLIAIPTPPPSPLSPLSSPLPQIPSPPLPLLSPPPTNPTYDEAPLGYRATRLRWRAEREDILEADLPLQKRLCTAHTGTYELGESSAAAAARLREPVRDNLYRFVDTVEQGEGSTPAAMKVGYGITDSWDELVGAIQETTSTTVEGVNQRVTELSTTFDRETSMIYAMIEENRDDQALQRARVNRLFKDRRYNTHTARLMKILDYSRDTTRGDQGVTGSRPQATGTIHTGTDCTKDMSDSANCSSRMHLDVRGHQRYRRRTTRANPATTITTTTTSLETLIEQGIAKALAARDADRNTNGDDNHVSRTVARRMERVTRECTYPDFMKCKPLNFKGTEGVVELNYALTWWKSYVMTVGPDVAYAMTWVDLKKKMTDKYCPKGEIKKLKSELWNLRVKSNDVRGNRTGQKPTCYECGSQGHFRKDCTKFKNNNHGAQGGNATAPAKVYAVGHVGTNPDLNVITDHNYDVELADGRIIGLNSILRGCTLNFLNHPFNIDLMPVELGSFDAIIGMDWLAKYHAVIVCAEKITRIPWGNKILIVHGNGSDRRNKTRLNIISCTKTQKYIQKGCHVFLAHITTQETEEKSEKKRLEDVKEYQEKDKIKSKPDKNGKRGEAGKIQKQLQ